MDVGVGLSSPSVIGSRAWTPLRLRGDLLAWWWAAPQHLTLSGESVTGWADLKSDRVVVPSTVAGRPLWTPTGYGGRPGVTFDGLDDALVGSGAGLPAGSDPCEIWGVVDQQSLAGDTSVRVWAAIGSGAFAADRRARRAVSGGVSRVNGSAMSISQSAQSGVFLGRSVARIRFLSTLLTAQQVGASGTSVPVALNSLATRVAIGARPDAGGTGECWQGLIRHVVITMPLAGPAEANMVQWLLRERGAP